MTSDILHSCTINTFIHIKKFGYELDFNMQKFNQVEKKSLMLFFSKSLEINVNYKNLLQKLPVIFDGYK